MPPEIDDDDVVSMITLFQKEKMKLYATDTLLTALQVEVAHIVNQDATMSTNECFITHLMDDYSLTKLIYTNKLINSGWRLGRH